MSSEFLWYIIGSDGRLPWEPEGQREVDLTYLQQIAVATERLGFAGSLIASGLPDGWVLSSALATVTERVKFLVAIYPGITSPAQLAKTAVSFNDLFGGDRLLINVINGEDPVVRALGNFLPKEERYEQSVEYWQLFRRLTEGEVVDHDGEYFKLEKAGARWDLPAGHRVRIPLWFGGSSDAALAAASRFVDRYLTWVEPLDRTADKLGRVRDLARAAGREISFGLRAPLIVRDTDDEAWEVADRYLRETRPATFEARLANLRAGGTSGGRSVGVQRGYELVAGRSFGHARDLEVAPNLWGGYTLIQGGPPTAIVGSPQSVAARLLEYRTLGIDRFIVSGFPLLEETYRVAETVIPLVRAGEARIEAELEAEAAAALGPRPQAVPA
ncbi:MAG: LLM class flavin-dependent oxidoreductase [Acidimicrobiia bacterium]